MEEEQLRRQLGANLATFRKNAGLTQAGLAEKLNYTDKAVSKWERGESMPDVATLVQLARIYDVTVNDLLTDAQTPPPEAVVTGQTARRRRADRGVIQKLCSILVWFVALLIFVVVSTLGIPKSWITFIYAIPANAIVLLSLRSAWHRFSWNQVLISIIVWGTLLSFYMSLLVFAQFNAWKIFLLGIPGQLAIYLWFRMFRPVQKEEETNE